MRARSTTAAPASCSATRPAARTCAAAPRWTFWTPAISGTCMRAILYLTGRAKRIVKVLGVRTSLDDLERMVERPGHPAAVICGTDDVMHLVGAGDTAVHEQQRQATGRVAWATQPARGLPARRSSPPDTRRKGRLPSIGDGHRFAREARSMKLTNWRQLSDRGPDLVLCLDFPGGRAAAGFAGAGRGGADRHLLPPHTNGPAPARWRCASTAGRLSSPQPAARCARCWDSAPVPRWPPVSPRRSPRPGRRP